ncbi:hypothetical protein BJX99DRAFT_260158 [Aspergillus californicus]
MVTPEFVRLLTAACLGIAAYNTIVLFVWIFNFFKSWRGLYFWIILATTISIGLFTVIATLACFNIAPYQFSAVGIALLCSCVFTCQIFVLYSRLNLIAHDLLIRIVFWALIITSVFIFVPYMVTLLGFAADPERFLGPERMWDKVVAFSTVVRELMLSVLFLYQALHQLQPILAVKRRAGCKFITHLVAFIIISAVMDAGVLATVFVRVGYIGLPYICASSSIKLIMEFGILNKLVDLLEAPVHGHNGPFGVNDLEDSQVGIMGSSRSEGNANISTEYIYQTTIELGRSGVGWNRLENLPALRVRPRPYPDKESLISMNYDPTTASHLIASFLAITAYNTIVLLIWIFTFFKRWRGLYFWSILTATLSLGVFMVFTTLSRFHKGPPIVPNIGITIVYPCLLTAQILLLYSRLHLISQGLLLRIVLWAIVATTLIFSVPFIVSVICALVDTPRFLNLEFFFERWMITGSAIREILFCFLYLYQAIRQLQPVIAVKGKAGRNVIIHLLFVISAVIVLDACMLYTTFSGIPNLGLAYSCVSHSAKLMMEFGVLNQLLDLMMAPVDGHGQSGMFRLNDIEST